MFYSHGPVAGPAEAGFSPPGPGESAVLRAARQRDPPLPVHRDREPGLVRLTRRCSGFLQCEGGSVQNNTSDL